MKAYLNLQRGTNLIFINSELSLNLLSLFDHSTVKIEA